MTTLRQRMTEDMQVRNLALNTQTCYIHAATGPAEVLVNHHLFDETQFLGPLGQRVLTLLAFQVMPYLLRRRLPHVGQP